MQERVELFQFLFIQGEIVNFIDCVTLWAHQLQESSDALDTMKNCLFSHVFRFDYEKLRQFSQRLSDTFVNSRRSFKDALLKIVFRLVKRIVGAVTFRKIVKMDLQQLHIRIEAQQLPIEMAEELRNGIMCIGNHCSFRGKVVKIHDIQPMVIRYFYRCRNSECVHSFYLRPRERFGAVHCRRCGELASEDVTGRVVAGVRHVWVAREDGFSFRPINVLLKGRMCQQPTIKLGHTVDVCGVVSHETESVFHITADRITHAIHRPVCDLVEPSIRALLTEMEGFIPRLFKPVVRVIFLAMCSAIMQKSVVIIVKSIEEMKYVAEALQSAFGRATKVFFPSKTMTTAKDDLPRLLSCENGIVIVPHVNVLSDTAQERFLREVRTRTVPVGDCKFNCGVVAITVSPGLAGLGESRFDCFDLMIRIGNIDKEFIEDMFFRSCFSGNPDRLIARILAAKHMADSISIDDDAEQLLSTYLKRCRRDTDIPSLAVVEEVASCIAAFRQSLRVTPFDVYMAIYFFEEKDACLSGADGLFSQLPTSTHFFTEAVSSIAMGDEELLFQCWSNFVDRTIADS